MFSWAIGRISKEFKNEFVSATVNEPSVCESLKFYCVNNAASMAYEREQPKPTTKNVICTYFLWFVDFFQFVTNLLGLGSSEKFGVEGWRWGSSWGMSHYQVFPEYFIVC